MEGCRQSCRSEPESWSSLWHEYKVTKTIFFKVNELGQNNDIFLLIYLIKGLNFLFHDGAAWSEKNKDVQGSHGDGKKGVGGPTENIRRVQ